MDPNDISPIIFSIPDHSVHNVWCLLLSLIGPEFFGASETERVELKVESRAPWKDLAPAIWEWNLTKALCKGKTPQTDHPGNAIFRRLSKFKRDNISDTRYGNWNKITSEHEMIKMFLKLSYPINAFDRRLHIFLKWFRCQRYMAPALWDEVCWGLRILLHHNVLSPLDTRTYPLNVNYPYRSVVLASDSEEEEEEEEEEDVVETLFDSVERFKKYIFFLIQGSEGPMTNDEICQICKRETGLFPKQHMVHLSIHESLTGFICKYLSDRVESMTDEKTITHVLRSTPLPSCTNLPPINILKKENSTSSQISDKQPTPSPPTPTLQTIPPPPEIITPTVSTDFDTHHHPQMITSFSSLQEYADYIYSVIEKIHPVRNDIISASCRMDTGVYPRHHFKELGYEGFLTKFIRSYLGRKVLSKKCENGDWIHDLMSPEEIKRQIGSEEGLEDPIDKTISDDPDEKEESEPEIKNLAIQPAQIPPEPTPADSVTNEAELQQFKNYLYSVVRSFSGPITFGEINAQCLHDLESNAATLLINLGYTEKFMIFIRNYLRGYVLCYHRDGQAYYIASPKQFPAFTPMKLVKTYPITTLSLYAEFVYSQVVALGGLNAPVSYYTLDTRCTEVIGASIQQHLTTLEWRSSPNKFLSTYPSGRLIVFIQDGVTCIRVKSSQHQQSLTASTVLYDVSKPLGLSSSTNSGRIVSREVHITK